MVYIPTKQLTVEQFIAQYGDDLRYELADGELVDMEPTGPHEAVSGKVAARLILAIAQANHPWLIPRTCLIQPELSTATARRPDVIVLDETELSEEPLWQRQSFISSAKSIKLVVEVVSTNWENDYARKVEEYANFGIPEYWIVDFRGLGGTAFIGRPKQPTFIVATLDGYDYNQVQYRLGQPSQSPLFPELSLQLDDLMPR